MYARRACVRAAFWHAWYVCEFVLYVLWCVPACARVIFFLFLFFVVVTVRFFFMFFIFLRVVSACVLAARACCLLVCMCMFV